MKKLLLPTFFVAVSASAQTVSLSTANTQTSYDVGANLTLSISTTANTLVGMALVQVGNPLSLVAVPAPYSATIVTTPDMIGLTSFQAVAILGPGQVITSNIVTIDVEPTQTPTNINVSPLNPTLTFRGQQSSFTVLGQIGTSTAALSNATQLSVVSSNPQVVQVGTDKSFTALASGTTSLVVTYGSFNTTIPVVVSITEAGDLDGNGVIDQDDLNILLTFLNTNDTVPSDGRDLNNDGVINIADANILAGLCATTCTIPSKYSSGGSSQTITFGSVATQVVGTPLALGATANSGLAVSYSASPSSVCTVSGSTATFTAAGTCTIIASQSGNATYAAAVSVQQSFAVLESQTITFSPVAAQLYGSTLTLSATASSGLPVTYTVAPNDDCSVAGSVVKFLNVGSCGVIASQGGNGTYAAAQAVGQTIVITPAPQSITFGAIPPQTVFTQLTVSAIASSGLPVSFAVVASGSCNISANLVTLQNVGTCSVVASQSGNSDYIAAQPVTQAIVVNPAPQTITFGSIQGVIQGASVTVSATASSGLPVNFTSLTPGVCLVSSKTISTPHPGTCTIQAAQPGGGNYAPAAPVTQSFTVTPAFTITANPQNQTIVPGLPVLANLQIQAATNFNGFVTLTCSGGPTGSSCLGNSVPVLVVNGKGLASVSILVPLTTPNGSYVETVTLTSGALTDVGTVNFTVKSLL